MNYIEEMNAFNVWITLHPEVSTSAQVLWYVLMHYNNTCSWKKQFSVPMSMLMTSTRLSESSVKRARLALQKAGRIRYSVRPGKKATVYEMISMEEEGIVTTFLSGNSTAIATDISDGEEIVSEEIDSAGVVNLAEEDAKGTVSEKVVSEKVISEKVVSEDVAIADAGNADQCTLQNKNQCDLPNEEQCDLQNNDQTISQNEGEHISKNEGQSDCLGELLPERLPERPAERLAERLPERILKLNETRLNISKESTKKGSEAILVEPQENTFENAEEDMSQSISESKSKSTAKPIAKSTSKSVPKSVLDSTSKSVPKYASKSCTDDEEAPFVPPTLEMVQAYCKEKGYHIDPEAFMAYYDAVGWSVGKKTMKSWKRAAAYWERNEKKWKAEAKERRDAYRSQGYGSRSQGYRSRSQRDGSRTTGYANGNDNRDGSTNYSRTGEPTTCNRTGGTRRFYYHVAGVGLTTVERKPAPRRTFHYHRAGGDD